jgi:hypothetical protein
MGALVDVDKIKDCNWSRYIHEWLMWYIKKYQAEPLNAKQLNRTLGGCIYHLAVCFCNNPNFWEIEINGFIKIPNFGDNKNFYFEYKINFLSFKTGECEPLLPCFK